MLTLTRNQQFNSE